MLSEIYYSFITVLIAEWVKYSDIVPFDQRNWSTLKQTNTFRTVKLKCLFLKCYKSRTSFILLLLSYLWKWSTELIIKPNKQRLNPACNYTDYGIEFNNSFYLFNCTFVFMNNERRFNLDRGIQNCWSIMFITNQEE